MNDIKTRLTNSLMNWCVWVLISFSGKPVNCYVPGILQSPPMIGILWRKPPSHQKMTLLFFHGEHQGTACSLQWAFSGGSLWTSTQQQPFYTMGDYTGLIPRLHPRPRTNSGEELKQLTALCPKGKNNGKQVISSDSPWIGLRLLNKVPCLHQWHFCKVMPFSDFLWLISA